MRNDPATVSFFPWLAAAKGLALGLVLVVASPAAATQEYILPTLFDVAGVAANDVLNIRAAPDAGAPVIGTLSPRARDIEVVGYDASGRWARINTGERSGWAALRYLAYQVDVWPPGALPPTLHCLGNEPFWSFRPRGGNVVFSTPDAPESVMRIEQVLATGVFRDPRRSVSAQGDSRRMTAVMVPAACSDGMSDRSYGLDVTVILEGGGEPRMLTGCCSIAPR
ncbi:SH3 domain-containing protein [Paracoccaceae bacterium Fryx2]|nr:SH3 domain-containing protein [Paracoccaceae bacterium Fryx2]